MTRPSAAATPGAMQNLTPRGPFSRITPLVLALLGAGTVLAACSGDATGEPTAVHPRRGRRHVPGRPGAGGASSSAPQGTGSATAAASQGEGGAPSPASTSLFRAPEPWTKDVAGMSKSESSDAIVGWLSDHGGWGTHTLRIDFSIKVLHATGDVPFRSFSPTEEFYAPDCDQVPFPLPAGGSLEDEQGYQCTTDGDCHLIVVHEPSQKLYEMWRANVSATSSRAAARSSGI